MKHLYTYTPFASRCGDARNKAADGNAVRTVYAGQTRGGASVGIMKKSSLSHVRLVLFIPDLYTCLLYRTMSMCLTCYTPPLQYSSKAQRFFPPYQQSLGCETSVAPEHVLCLCKVYVYPCSFIGSFGGQCCWVLKVK